MYQAPQELKDIKKLATSVFTQDTLTDLNASENPSSPWLCLHSLHLALREEGTCQG
jgi:hypothetical protein